MRREIIQILACDNYDFFNTSAFYFQENSFLIFLKILFNQETDPRAKYLSMKEGSLFCFVVMRSTPLGCFRSCCWCLWKALDEEGCMGFGSMAFGLAMQKSS
jgi:hypothetical protein